MSLAAYEVLNDYDHAEATTLSALIRSLNLTGHNPATSGNYSVRSQNLPEVALVSESGIDKSLFSEKNLIPIHINSGNFFSEKDHGRKSSDETGLHLAIYQATDAKCVLHSHILESILFADLFEGQDKITLSGLELLKGFKGIKTHEAEVDLPVLNNSQDIEKLALDVKAALQRLQNPAFAFLLRGHGFYVWGASVKDAKRHLEVLEYIFKYHVERRRLLA